MARGAGMAGSSSMARPFARYVSFNVLGMVGVSVYILADTFFIANGVGSDGLAALNFSIVLYTVLQATGLMLGIGAATEFQVCSARGDRTGANRVFTTALVMAGCAAAVLLAVVEAFATPLASLLGADEATLPLTVTYLRTIFAFAPLFLLNNVLLPFVRNDGSPQLAMVAMLVGSFGNIALDALFIFGFGWGMFGAAFATGFAPLMSMAVLLIHFLRKRNTFRPVRLHLRAQALHHGAAFGVLAREEAAEIEARVRAAAGHVRRGHGRGARQHLHRHARLAGGAHEAQPRIGHARHAGVRAVRDHFACRHALNQRRRALADERLVQPLDALLDAECR